MKNLKNGLYPLLILIVTLAIGGCKKENGKLDSADNGDLNNKISLVNGRMVFQDEASFNSYIKLVYQNQSSPEKLENLFLQKDFNSMLDIYNVGMSKNKETDEFIKFCKSHNSVFYPLNIESSLIYELQAPYVYAAIANESGIFQIGKKIIRITSNNTLTITNGDESKIPLLMMPIESITDPAIEIKSTQSKALGEYSYRTTYFNNTNHRIVARLKETESNGTYIYEARTTAQKKILGVWVQENISTLTLSWAAGNVSLDCAKAWGVYAFTVIGTDWSDLQRTVIICGAPAIFSCSSCIATHSGTLSGQTITITPNDVFPG